MVDTTEIYDYHDDDIVVMTDEEENKGTKHWPSKDNIVGFLITGYSVWYAHSPGEIELQLRAMDDLVRSSSSHDAFVFFCELSCVTLPLLADRIPKMLVTVAALRTMAHRVAHVSPTLTTLIRFPSNRLMAMSDILTCDNEKIIGHVSVPHSEAVRHHSTLAGRPQAPCRPTSQGLPPDSKAPVSLAIETY
jgi:hypothetical protein